MMMIGKQREKEVKVGSLGEQERTKGASETRREREDAGRDVEEGWVISRC